MPRSVGPGGPRATTDQLNQVLILLVVLLLIVTYAFVVMVMVNGQVMSRRLYCIQTSEISSWSPLSMMIHLA